MQKISILRLALPTPLRKTFDYLAPNSESDISLEPGMRVLVPFGKRQLVGILLEVSDNSDFDLNKLKSAIQILDHTPLFTASMLTWLRWMADYYHHPIGEVFSSALPALLRQGKDTRSQETPIFIAEPNLDQHELRSLMRAPKQKALLEYIQSQPTGVTIDLIRFRFEHWQTPVNQLLEKGFIRRTSIIREPKTPSYNSGPTLNAEQQNCVNEINSTRSKYRSFVLQGITGSGKTEVYLNAIQSLVESGLQAMVLVPEIGLTPQFLARFEQRFGGEIAILHSGMSDGERLHHWTLAQQGRANILIGTRSAVFTPLPRLGIIIVDEEHDNSYKQQDSFRYSARDMAVVRARREGIPVVLGSATPSFESMRNVEEQRYQVLHLTKRAGDARPPAFHLLDLKGQPLQENFSHALVNTMRKHLDQGNQVLLFLNRRGFAPSLICHECSWVAMCKRCELPLTFHQQSRRLRCHHCGSERQIPQQCPDCSNLNLFPRGYGTERVEQFLNAQFPDVETLRIDRDTTRGKNKLHSLLERIHLGEKQILLGTQMLAKGHDFPNVTLVGILDADQGLYGTDFRATEKLAQLITQVAGRAGRGSKRGQVLIQTHYPDHPLLQTLVHDGYEAFVHAALMERRDALLPPYTHAVLFRAESNTPGRELTFLQEITSELYGGIDKETMVLGPTPSPIEKRAGRFRSQLLLLSKNRAPLHQLVQRTLPLLEKERRVRWSIDIDPLDLS
ncbi:MAG: primosomal protein N' [Gammaproteobacteria bacterium]|nr:primosomal protein N' [Gammaproteobacteria bacterium]